MEDDLTRQLLRNLGKKRRRLVQEDDNLRQEIHHASIRAKTAGWNNQQIAEEIGVTREIIRRHVGPSAAYAKLGKEVERGAQESS